MKLIALAGENGKGKFVMVDNEDFDLINSFRWHVCKSKRTYYATKANKKSTKKTLMHRLILNITNRNILVDHVDGNGLNNQKNNLRPCTQSQNQANRKSTFGKSKYLGVVFHENKRKGLNKHGEIFSPNSGWVAAIGVNKKRIHLGRFKTEDEAALRYNEAAKQYFGEFATINIIK